MIQVGDVDPDIKKVINATQKALYEAIKICRPGQKFNMIGKTIE
jgi:methionyl aminopeptidase